MSPCGVRRMGDFIAAAQHKVCYLTGNAVAGLGLVHFVCNLRSGSRFVAGALINRRWQRNWTRLWIARDNWDIGFGGSFE